MVLVLVNKEDWVKITIESNTYTKENIATKLRKILSVLLSKKYLTEYLET